MKQLQVIVKDKNTLVLLENGMKDDQINLAELANVDLTAIEEIINSGRDQVYEKKIKELRVVLEQEAKSSLEIQELELSKNHSAEVNALKETISTYNANKTLEIERIQAANNLEVEKLKAIIKSMEESQKQILENEKLQLENKYMEEINNLKQQLNAVKPTHELEIAKIKGEYEEEISKLKLEHSEEINKKDAALNQKDMLYQELQNRKAALNVKMIGEGLETWCHNEMLSYMQNGFLNCKWNKDNTVVKDEGEATGSKADYIFKIYASEECNENELLAGVCLEMKDENPNSTHKKKNSDYLAALHKNRGKKGCKYAVLVSNLELDNPNDLPIVKVREYDDMYIVRPAYMVVLLNMLVSLTTNFKELLLEAKREELEIKAKLLAEFEHLKKSYLEDKLTKLEKDVNEIKKQSSNIIKAAETINNVCNDIINKYLGEIQIKLERFQINIEKEYRKYNKNNPS